MLIVISQPHFFDGEAQLINKLFAADMPLLHIRKPKATEQAACTLIEEIEEAYRPRLVLHQHWHIGRKYDIDRWHLPEKERKETMEKHTDIVYSTSIHQLKDYEQLNSSVFSYAFLGPVFDSISKQGYQAMDPENHPLHLRRKEIPLIALGGIKGSNATEAMALGFDGVAVLGWLWQHPHPVKALEQLLNILP